MTTGPDALRANHRAFIERYYNRLPVTIGAGLSFAGRVRNRNSIRKIGSKFCRSKDEFFQAWGDLSVR